MPTPQPKPPTAETVTTARDRHRQAATDTNLGPTARRYHQHAACAYDWALQALGTPTADRHLGYAHAYAEQAANHAPATTRKTLTLPGPFCDWLTETSQLPADFTGHERDDRLLLAYRAGTAHRIDPSSWSLTIPAYDAMAMYQLTQIARRFAEHCLPDNKTHTPAQVRAAVALGKRLKDLSDDMLHEAN
ncbi:hypothetical protein [Kitasatospora sp. NBC_01300]|uniref:hypothetical protein n=1 Tax=Kitasatospora sp. NBC_01300 TaxID=2903574 RepID=UPI00352D09A3|nr:hypothetical protein OG556_16055 [Kitasatospora sp. NBC_01300]